LAHKRDPVGLTRDQIYGFLVGTRAKAEGIGGRRMWQEDIGSLKKPEEIKIAEEKSHLTAQ
jgi:hypothetical protein